ncbi:type II secretion system F family protein [Francisella sp. TX07-6608]|uniref:type II secretion system F family protein n=1 Tax=Francisella sp. TX07-6608 TaxID=573568 RepID=UPI0009230EB3|nr:type II secretion system F family protein [Francisella sp. TX07-6608]OIN82951.1 type II secretion system (T2SS), F family protein [Francisella sp. TX07-6608]
MLAKLKLLLQSQSLAQHSYSMYGKFKLLVLRLCFFSFIRVEFYEQLAALLKADIAMYDALTLMRAKYQTHKRLFKSYWLERKILDDMIYRVSSGYGSLSLAELLEGLVPNSDLVILAVDSRKSIDALDKVTAMMAKFNKLRLEVAKMFFTPVASLLLMVVLIFMANYFVFPILLQIKSLNDLPEMTYNLYVFCHFFADHLLAISNILVILSVIIISSLANFTGFTRSILDKLPPYNIYKQIMATSFLISLSLLLQSGDDFFTAIGKIKTRSSNYLSGFLIKIHERIGLGDRSGEALASVNLFNQRTQIYIEILDQAQALSQGISNLTDRSVDMQIRSIKRLLSIISTVLLFAVIIFGLWFYVAIGDVGLTL